MAIKVVSLRQAVQKLVKPGCHIAFGGFSLCRNAMAVSHEIIRQRIGDLKLSSVNPSYSVDILIGAGLVREVESGCLNMERLGLPRNFCRAVEQGILKSEDYEHGAMTFRYLAGSLGIPFIPTKSMLGSDILARHVATGKCMVMTSPFGNEKVVLLPPCRPDVAVIHVPRADEQGNCQIDGTTFADEFIAKAADHIILVTEELIGSETIRREPDATVIPDFRVDAVVHCPWGAYPTAVPGYYDYDYEALKSYQQASSNPASFQAYLERFVYGVKDFDEFLEIAGTPKTYRRLAIDPKLGYSNYVNEVIGGREEVRKETPGEYNFKELMIIAAAREINDEEIIIAGTGLPMAATTVAKLSRAPNCKYVVETGIGDLKPRHSAISVADLRLMGVAEPTFVSGILEALGHVVHRGFADVGFLGGAQIDMYGNLNATLLGTHERPAKRFPGSGGANVIASCAKRVLVIMQQEKRRFVERVDYITSPGFLTGGNSRWEAGLTGGGPDKVITDLGVLGFDEESKRMKLVSVHPGITVQQIRDATGFELIVPDHVGVTPAPSEEELRILRENVSPVYFADPAPAPAKALAAKAGGHG